MEKTVVENQTIVVTPEAMLEHWQGHRNLTRRAIEAFPEDKLFTYSIGGMRPFAQLVIEMITIAQPGIEGIATREWKKTDGENLHNLPKPPKTKEELLKLWDELTDHINEWWPKIPSERFMENDVAFGMYEGPIYSTLFYFIDNEIHHRGQGYVYLRSLGIEPPYFWER